MSRNYLSRLIIIVDKNNNPLMTSIRSICNFNLKTPAIGKYGSLYHHFGGTKVHAHGLKHDINSVIQFVTIFKMKHWKIEIRIILKTQFKQKRNTLVGYRWVPHFSGYWTMFFKKMLNIKKYYFKGEIETIFILMCFYNFLPTKNAKIENLRFAEDLFNRSPD